MPGVLTAMASGPGRLRAELRWRTRRLTALVHAGRGLAAVGTRVPPSLLGHDLAALAGGRLRGLLQPAIDPAEAPAPTSVRHIGADGPQGPCSRSPRSSAIAGTPAFEPAPAWPAPPASPPAASVEPMSAVTQPPGRAVPAVSGIEREGRTLVAPAAPEQRRVRTTEVTATRHVRRRGPDEPRPQLVEALRRYWARPEAEDPARGSPAGVPAHAVAPRAPSPPLAGRLAGDGGAGGPATTVRALDRRLRSFLTGDRRSLAATAETLAAPGQRVQIHNVFNVTLPEDGRRDATAELAERIGDILREQALEHGISVP
jgi:hypothetical protein